VLLSLAQFEREIISERTRDKIAATRRKGKWAGGRPLLGYDVVDKKLVVHPEEAERVRQVFYLYLEMQSLLAVVAELRRRGWTTKQWATRKGTIVGGLPFTKTNLHQLLTNVAYVGRVRYKSEVHHGEHEAIVDEAVFDQVRKLLKQNGRSGSQSVRTKHSAMLRGILRCTACDCAMTHSYSTRKNRRYRYYVCANAQKQGWKACPSPSVPAGEIERFVMEQIKTVGGDPAVLQETLVQIASQSREGIDRRNSEREMVQRQLRDENAELHRLSTVATIDEAGMTRLAEVQERIRLAERRLTEINLEIQRLRNRIVDKNDVATALTAFEPVWEMLSPREKARVLGLLVERVDYDGKEGSVAITFRSTGIRDLAGAQERVA
jgi:site-specific DNA recombinase